MAMKKPTNKRPTAPRHGHQNTAGENASKKTRADVPSTPANKAASGKLGHAQRSKK